MERSWEVLGERSVDGDLLLGRESDGRVWRKGGSGERSREVGGEWGNLESGEPGEWGNLAVAQEPSWPAALP